MSERPLSDRYSTDVLHLLADRHLSKERERLLAYRDEIAALEAKVDCYEDAMRAYEKASAERDRLLARLVSYACDCGMPETTVDPELHRDDCEYRAALEGGESDEN